MRCLFFIRSAFHMPLGASSLRYKFSVSRLLHTQRAAIEQTEHQSVTQRSPLTDFGLSSTDDTFVPGVTLDPFYVCLLTPSFGIPRQKEPNIPKRCIGCGSLFQHSDSTKPGYTDAEVLRDFGARGLAKIPNLKGVEVDRAPEGVQVDKCDDGRFQRLKRRALCRRCYRLQHYKRLDLECDVTNVGDDRSDNGKTSRDKTTRLVNKPETKQHGTLRMPEEADKARAAKGSKIASAPEVISDLARRIKNDGLVLYVVDIVNVEATLLPELYIAIRNKAVEVIWIINKVDVLPNGADLPSVKRWLRSMARHIGNAKNSDVFLVSSTKGTGLDALERRLKAFLNVGNARPIYVVGAVNAGKSTFVNRFLSYISYGDAGTLQIKRGTGGATRSSIPGTTLEFIEFGLYGGFKLIDTPGIPLSSTFLQVLHRPVDLVAIALNKTLNPFAARLDEGQSLVLGALARVDMVQGSAANIHCFFSGGITVEVCRTVAAADIMNYKAGVRSFPPHAKEDYNKLLPFSKYRVIINCTGPTPEDDIVLPGLGWIAPSGTGPKVLDLYVPKGVDILRRSALVRNPPKKIADKTFLRGRGRLRKVLTLRREMITASRRESASPSV